MAKIIECVPNISEGRNHEVIEACIDEIRKTAGVTLLDYSSDASHNRSVITFIGDPEGVINAAVALEKKAKELQEKLKKNAFTLSDYYDQLVQLRGMGSMQDIAGMLPGGAGKALAGAKLDERALARTEAIILSMTQEERDNPSIINHSRKKRIAAGSGTTVVDLNKLLKQYEMLKQLTKQMQKGKMPNFGGGKRGRGGMFGF